MGSSVERAGMHDLHQSVVVPVIHRDPNHHRASHLERPLQSGCELFRLSNHHPFGAKGLGQAHDIDWAELALTCGYYDQSHLYRDFRECQAITATSSMTFTWTEKISSAVHEACP